jgi:hypothetical protein
MDEVTVKTTITNLLSKIETLQAENTRLVAINATCTDAVSKLTSKVENLKSVVEEMTITANKSPYRSRPEIMRGRTVQKNVGCGPIYVTLNEDEDGKPFEVFFKLGKSGSCQQSYLEALGVAMSVGLRYGADPQKFVDKLAGMRCPLPLSRMQNRGKAGTLSCADAISQGIAQALALALPGTELEGRSEALIQPLAEPVSQPSPLKQAQAKSATSPMLDLIGLPSIVTKPATNGHTEYPAVTVAVDRRKAMLTGVGLCPKCNGPLINQGGCTSCLQQCGYVGKCS